MRSQAADRPRLDRVDGQRAAVDAPAGAGAQILVVVPQVPHQVGGAVVGDAEMVCDAGDAAQRVVPVGSRRVHLADDRVLGSRQSGQRAHRGPDAVAATERAHRLERSGWIGEP
jgi:hypothetical protein